MRWVEIIKESQYYFGGFKSEPSGNIVSKYMRGWCPYFALALHDLYGYTIVATADHFAVKSKADQFIDIRGVMTPEQFSDGLSDSTTYEMSRDELISDMEAGLYKCGYFNERDLNQARQLVRKLFKP